MKIKRSIHSAIAAVSLIALSGVAVQSLNSTAQASITVADDNHDAKAIKIINSMIEALGGRESIESIESMKSTGTISIPMAGLSGSVESYAMTPDKFFLKIDLAAMGQTLQGLNGTTAWSSDAMNGPRILPPEEAGDIIEQADLHLRLNYEEDYKMIKFEGETVFESEKAYKLKLTDHDDVESTEYYSIESGLQIGSEIVANTAMGVTNITVLMQDYKDLGGHIQPTKIVQKVGPTQIIIEISDVEYNKVDESVFELPAAVKALLDAKQAP
ncbi:MAG: hypothetical protein P1U42_00340 [Phycisphaerales bacterium]|nr:hypothetical protein [Phycisphaerales bacterium]